jgi:hypothetical protein
MRGDHHFMRTFPPICPQFDLGFLQSPPRTLATQDAEFFVTWRLHGSLPRHMDHANTGPLWLRDPRVAECVSQTLLAGEAK